MEMKVLPKDPVPPYPNPSGNNGFAVSHPGMYGQEALPPGAPPPPPYQEVPYTGMYPQLNVPSGAPPTAGYPGVTQLVIIPPLRDTPGQAVCPRCQQTVLTTTEHTPGLMTWVICAVLTFLGYFLCCCIPFCIKSCKDVEHRCPLCQTVIYTHRPM